MYIRTLLQHIMYVYIIFDITVHIYAHVRSYTEIVNSACLEFEHSNVHNYVPINILYTNQFLFL